MAFLLGADLTGETLAKYGRAIITLSLVILCGTTLIVWASVLGLGVAPGLALLLRAIATASAPARQRQTNPPCSDMGRPDRHA